MREGSRKLQLRVPLSSNEVSGCDLLTSFNHLIQMFTHGTQWPEFSLLSDDSKWLFPAYHWPINCKPREEKRKILCNNFWICHATPPPPPHLPQKYQSPPTSGGQLQPEGSETILCARFHGSGWKPWRRFMQVALPPRMKKEPQQNHHSAAPPPYYETLTWSQLRSALPGKVRGVHKGK